MNFKRNLALVSWSEVKRDGDFIFMRRGTDETGWWHVHKDGNEVFMRYDKQSNKYQCRECDAFFLRSTK